MRRLTCTLILFTACLATIVGCRRGASERRAPTPNHSEADMLPGRREQEASIYARPKDRRAQIWSVNVREEEIKLKNGGGDPKAFWKKVGASQKEMENNKEASEKAGKLKEAAERADRQDEFMEFGKQCLDYLKKNAPKEYSEENAIKWFRRNKLFYARKWLDPVDGVLVEERIWYAGLIAEKKATFVPFVDLKDAGYPYLMCTTESTSGGGGMMDGGGGGGGGQSGPNAIYSDLRVGSVKGVRDIMNQQELRILQRNYVSYASRLRLDKGEQPTYKDFIKYLRENAPAALLQDINEKFVYVHEPADGILRGNLACRTDSPGYLTVTVSSPQPLMQPNPFPGAQIPRPAKKDANEGGMPGMPGR